MRPCAPGRLPVNPLLSGLGNIFSPEKVLGGENACDAGCPLNFIRSARRDVLSRKPANRVTTSERMGAPSCSIVIVSTDYQSCA
jgi:hypothetical protein